MNELNFWNQVVLEFGCMPELFQSFEQAYSRIQLGVSRCCVFCAGRPARVKKERSRIAVLAGQLCDDDDDDDDAPQWVQHPVRAAHHPVAQ